MKGVGTDGARPTVRIRADTSAITEGEPIVFTITANPAPRSDLPVSLELHETGEFGVVEKRPPGGRVPLPSVRVVNLTVPAGRSSAVHTVNTKDDGEDEPNGQVLGSISCERSRCEIDFANDLVRVKVNDDDGGPEVHVSVDGSVTEGGTVTFRFTTDPPGVNLTNVRFRYTVRGGDFGARILPNAVVIPRGETGLIKFHSLQNGIRDTPVYTTDDGVEEPYGQVTVTVLPPQGQNHYQLPRTSAVFSTADIYDNDGPPPPPARPWWELEGDSRLTVRWDEVPDATGYDVEWGATAEQSRQTTRVTRANFTTPELSPGVKYTFEVSACNDAGCSEPSPEVQGSVEQETTADWASPNFRAVDGSPPLIRWDAYPEATGYRVEFTAPINWTGRKDNGYAEMSNEGPEYTMRAKAHGDGWESEWTEWFNTCRPPYAHQGGPGDSPSCAEAPDQSHVWAAPSFRVNEGTTPPQIEWNPYPNATGYTVEFTAPINWTGRKDNGYAEMSNDGPQYTMRAKAHGDGWESEWTDWFNTCRPPYVHQGGPNDPPDCVQSTESTETPPTADAGSDRQAERGERVELSDSGASHGDGSQELSYRWRIADASHSELRGTAAFLASANRAQAAFTCAVPRRGVGPRGGR